MIRPIRVEQKGNVQESLKTQHKLLTTFSLDGHEKEYNEFVRMRTELEAEVTPGVDNRSYQRYKARCQGAFVRLAGDYIDGMGLGVKDILPVPSAGGKILVESSLYSAEVPNIGKFNYKPSLQFYTGDELQAELLILPSPLEPGHHSLTELQVMIFNIMAEEISRGNDGILKPVLVVPAGAPYLEVASTDFFKLVFFDTLQHAIYRINPDSIREFIEINDGLRKLLRSVNYLTKRELEPEKGKLEKMKREASLRIRHQLATFIFEQFPLA